MTAFGISQAAGGPGSPFVVACSFSGPVPAATRAVIVFSSPVSFEAGWPGSTSNAVIAATGAAAFGLAKLSTGGVLAPAGTATVPAGGRIAAVSAPAVSFAAGDALVITTPATADATLADFGLVLVGTKD